jgi:SAM-dependent methyltransferase
MMTLEIENTLNLSLQEYIEANKTAWDKKVTYDVESSYYNVKDFVKGKSSLNKLELDLLGNIQNKKLLHLQCYFGLDTLSFARLGAVSTGVDFSENAINYARNLSKNLSLNTDFICTNVYGLSENVNDQYDLAYSSYGAICWLPDLDLWAKEIYDVLKPGGSFYLIDFHPLIISYDLLRVNYSKYSYFNSRNTPIKIIRKGTYANENADIETVEYNWNHSIAEIFNAFLKNDFRIDKFNEYPFIPINGFPNLELRADGNYYQRESKNNVPILFSLKVTKK